MKDQVCCKSPSTTTSSIDSQHIDDNRTIIKKETSQKNLQLHKLYTPFHACGHTRKLPNEVQASHIPKPKPLHLVLFTLPSLIPRNKWETLTTYIT